MLRDRRIGENWDVGVLRGVWGGRFVEAPCGDTEGGEGPEREDSGELLLRLFELSQGCGGQQAWGGMRKLRKGVGE